MGKDGGSGGVSIGPVTSQAGTSVGPIRRGLQLAVYTDKEVVLLLSSQVAEKYA